MSSVQKHIFIVDDDPMLSEMLSDHLRNNPLYKVSVYSCGADCIKQLSEGPDVIILDYTLSSSDPNAETGMDLLQQIKKIDAHIPVIMLSSQDDYGVALQAIVKGAVEYVVKDKEAFARIDHILAK